MENKYKSCIKMSNTSKDTDYFFKTAVEKPDYDCETNVTSENIRNISPKQDIFKTVKYSLTLLVNETVKNQICSFIKAFESALNYFPYSFSKSLPRMSMENDTDSAFMEWAFRNFRVGFIFCEKKEDSMWFIVSNEELGRKNYSGDSAESQYYNIAASVLVFVIENT